MLRSRLKDKLVRVALVLWMWGLAAPALAVETQVCATGLFLVDAPNPDLGAEICAHLSATAERMSACGLEQTKQIRVEVVPEISHPVGTCLAYFDCEFELIRVTDPASYARILEDDNPYSRLPPPVLFRSLLTHELAHALSAQTAGDRQLDIVDQEYIAAAFELEFLAEEWRQALIQAAPVSLPPKPGMIDTLIYALEPRKFATNAWQHFRAQEDGCGLIAKIVAGQVSFVK